MTVQISSAGRESGAGHVWGKDLTALREWPDHLPPTEGVAKEPVQQEYWITCAGNQISRLAKTDFGPLFAAFGRNIFGRFCGL